MSADDCFIDKLKDPEGWLSSRAGKSRKVVAILRSIFPSLEGKRILDVGCSNWAVTFEVSREASFVVGCDVDIKALRLASEVPDGGGVFFVAADGRFLPFKSGFFDVSLLNQVLEYIPNPEAAVSEVRRVLAGAGVCYLEAVNRLFATPAKRIHFISKLFFKGETHLGTSYLLHQIHGFFAGFTPVDKTLDVIRTPRAYAVNNVPQPVSVFFHLLPDALAHVFLPLTPTWLILFIREKGGLTHENSSSLP